MTTHVSAWFGRDERPPTSGASPTRIWTESHGSNAKKSGATIPSHALETKGGRVPPEGARFMLDLGIREEDKERMLELLAKQQEGRMTAAERDELESDVQADHVLSILKAWAILAMGRSEREAVVSR